MRGHCQSATASAMIAEAIAESLQFTDAPPPQWEPGITIGAGGRTPRTLRPWPGHTHRHTSLAAAYVALRPPPYGVSDYHLGGPHSVICHERSNNCAAAKAHSQSFSTGSPLTITPAGKYLHYPAASLYLRASRGERLNFTLPFRPKAADQWAAHSECSDRGDDHFWTCMFGRPAFPPPPGGGEEMAAAAAVQGEGEGGAEGDAGAGTVLAAMQAALAPPPKVNATACRALWALRTDPASHPTAASLLFLGLMGAAVAPEPFSSPRVVLRKEHNVADGSGRFIVVHVRRGDSCEFFMDEKAPFQLIYWVARARPGSLRATHRSQILLQLFTRYCLCSIHILLPACRSSIAGVQAPPVLPLGGVPKGGGAPRRDGAGYPAGYPAAPTRAHPCPPMPTRAHPCQDNSRARAGVVLGCAVVLSAGSFCFVRPGCLLTPTAALNSLSACVRIPRTHIFPAHSTRSDPS